MSLFTDLQAAGLPVVEAEWGSTPLFSRELTPAEQDTLDSIFNKPAYRLKQSRITAKNIPAWATWTQEEWMVYFSANLADSEVDLVTSLATARVMIKRQNLVIKNLVKMVIALRDGVWADLPD
jgi:hypothetical protein